MGNPTASNHWLTSVGDHCKAISTMQEEDVGAVFGTLEEDMEIDIDEVEAEPKLAPKFIDPIPEAAELTMLPDKPLLLPNPMDGVRTNLGTRNQEFRRLPDS